MIVLCLFLFFGAILSLGVLKEVCSYKKKACTCTNNRNNFFSRQCNIANMTPIATSFISCSTVLCGNEKQQMHSPPPPPPQYIPTMVFRKVLPTLVHGRWESLNSAARRVCGMNLVYASTNGGMGLDFKGL